MIDKVSLRISNNDNFFVEILKNFGRGFASVMLWLIGSFAIGTLIAGGFCLYYGAPLGFVLLGGATLAAFTASLAIFAHSSSIFDFWS